MGMSTPASFGRQRPEPEPPQIPALGPVMHIGQVQAELVLTINQESLHEVGSAIATMVANATAQGFAAGWEHATGQPFGAPDLDPEAAAPADAPTEVHPGVDLDKL
jgi:hypothetical protein